MTDWIKNLVTEVPEILEMFNTAGEAPLYEAISLRRWAAIEMLISLGADPLHEQNWGPGFTLPLTPYTLIGQNPGSRDEAALFELVTPAAKAAPSDVRRQTPPSSRKLVRPLHPSTVRGTLCARLRFC